MGLVLTRKVGEGVLIECPDGNEIMVDVARVRGGNGSGNGVVKLRITAPAEYLISRSDKTVESGTDEIS